MATWKVLCSFLVVAALSLDDQVAADQFLHSNTQQFQSKPFTGSINNKASTFSGPTVFKPSNSQPSSFSIPTIPARQTSSPLPPPPAPPAHTSNFQSTFIPSTTNTFSSNSFIQPNSPKVVHNTFNNGKVVKQAPRRGRQRGDAPAPPPGGIDFSQAQRTADGRLCVIKEAEVQALTKDPILECTHKNVEKCHYTYVTIFEPAQEEICDENFEKNCQITFKQQSTKETVKKCYRPLEKICNGQGPEECRTVYESSCTTKYVEKQPGKFVGDTSCEKLPVEICGAGCVTEEGPEECHDKEIDTLLDVPEETCDLNPQKTCRFATKLVPSLKPEHECTIVPKETCQLRFSAPRQETKPLRSEWCLDESPVVPDETYDDINSPPPLARAG